MTPEDKTEMTDEEATPFLCFFLDMLMEEIVGVGQESK